MRGVTWVMLMCKEFDHGMIPELFREYKSRYDVEAGDLKAVLQNSLQEKAASLADDAWVFGAEEEVGGDQSQ